MSAARPTRGQCPSCRFRFRLRADGAMQQHRIYSGGEGHVCGGSGKPAVSWDPNACGVCMDYLYGTPMLHEACWSVGIEVGKDGNALLREVLAAYHGNGHRELAAQPERQTSSVP